MPVCWPLISADIKPHHSKATRCHFYGQLKQDFLKYKSYIDGFTSINVIAPHFKVFIRVSLVEIVSLMVGF